MVSPQPPHPIHPTCATLAAAVFAGGALTGAESGTDTAISEGPTGSIVISWDNDLLANSDDHYTNGLQFGWVSGYLSDYADGPIPGFLGDAVQQLPGLDDDARQRFISYSLSHRIFTPNDITVSELIEDDLPYSAMLTGTLTTGSQSDRHMDAYSLTIGVVGPAALGEQIQSGVHQIVGSEEPEGWDNQLDNEILLNLGYEHRYRLTAFGDMGGWNGDVILQGGAMAGNMITMATAGIGARFGFNTPDDFGIPPQFFGEETIGSRPYSRDWQPYGIWGFVLLNGSVFANAIFWDGNTFEDSHSIDYDPAIGRLYTGIRGQYGNWGASFGITATTVPWDNPDDKSSQTYGRLAVGYSY